MLERLQKILAKDARLGIGLMSGTSLDGVDAALVRIHGSSFDTRIDVEAFHTESHPEATRERIRRVIQGPARDVCAINAELGDVFADACHTLSRKAGVSLADVDFVASHGHTIYHIPPGSDEGRASTLQVGDGAVIAARTGCLTITDFRVADMALGGQGAPLVPLFDCLVLPDPVVRRVALNIGGIANMTTVSRDLASVRAFDTGPGNGLLNDIVRRLFPDSPGYDRDGEIARRGKVDEALLTELLGHEYFAAPPPKSSGPELFVLREPFAGLIDRVPAISPEDLVATVTALSARSIAMHVREYAPEADEVIVSGGGVHNPVMMGMLAEALPDVRLRGLRELGIDPDAKEAAAFVVLGNETLHGRSGNVPGATGAAAGAVLGKISLPPA